MKINIFQSGAAIIISVTVNRQNLHVLSPILISIAISLFGWNNIMVKELVVVIHQNGIVMCCEDNFV